MGDKKQMIRCGDCALGPQGAATDHEQYAADHGPALGREVHVSEGALRAERRTS